MGSVVHRQDCSRRQQALLARSSAKQAGGRRGTVAFSAAHAAAPTLTPRGMLFYCMQCESSLVLLLFSSQASFPWPSGICDLRLHGAASPEADLAPFDDSFDRVGVCSFLHTRS